MNEESRSVSGVWERASAVIRRSVPETTFLQWFSVIVPLRMEEDSIVLGVSDDIFAKWLVSNYSDILEDGLLSAVGRKISFELETGHMAEIAPEKIPEIPAPAVSDTEAVSPAALNCQASYTFQNFIVGEENRYAYSAAVTAAQAPGKFNPLYIYGSTGMGKTHLIQAVANEVHRTNPAAVVRYVTCENFLNAYLDSLRIHSEFNSHSEFRNYFREVDLLLIDDVHQLGGKDQIQEEFFNTFNTLYNAGKQIILTSDKRPSEIPGLEARLVSRFESGVTTQITSPTTYETRLSILQHEQKEQTVKLPPDIIRYVAERISSSIRSLKGALMRLIAYSSLSHQTIPMSVAENLLSDLLDKEAAQRKVTIDSIQKVVAEHYGLKISDLTGSKRPKNIAGPRMIAMYLSRQMTNHSLTEIGTAFCRNHATVMHAVAQVEASVENDEESRRSVSMLKHKIQG